MQMQPMFHGILALPHDIAIWSGIARAKGHFHVKTHTSKFPKVSLAFEASGPLNP